MQLIGAYAYLGAEAVSEAVGETGRAIPEYICRIYGVHKSRGALFAVGYYTIGMLGAVFVYMVYSLCNGGYNFNG